MPQISGTQRILLLMTAVLVAVGSAGAILWEVRPGLRPGDMLIPARPGMAPLSEAHAPDSLRAEVRSESAVLLSWTSALPTEAEIFQEEEGRRIRVGVAPAGATQHMVVSLKRGTVYAFIACTRGSSGERCTDVSEPVITWCNERGLTSATAMAATGPAQVQATPGELFRYRWPLPSVPGNGAEFWPQGGYSLRLMSGHIELTHQEPRLLRTPDGLHLEATFQAPLAPGRHYATYCLSGAGPRIRDALPLTLYVPGVVMSPALPRPHRV